VGAKVLKTKEAQPKSNVLSNTVQPWKRSTKLQKPLFYNNRFKVDNRNKKSFDTRFQSKNFVKTGSKAGFSKPH